MLPSANTPRPTADPGPLYEATVLAQELVASGTVPGVGIVAELAGHAILECYFGQEEAGSPDRPVTDATIWPTASVTKPLSAAAIMRLVERGELMLETPVQSLCPEFEGEGKERVRLFHLLTHTSGLPGTITARGPFAPPLRFSPGERFNYSDNGYAVAGAMAERVTGLRFGEIVQREVLDPLGMTQASMFPPDEWLQHTAAVTGHSAEGQRLARLFNSADYRRQGAAQGGLFSTVRGLTPFLRAFLNGGAVRGETWLRRETVAAMTRPQVSGVPGGVGVLFHWDDVTWGIGWDVKGGKAPHWSGTLTSERTISHQGFSGTLVWADPTRDLLCVLFTNRTFADPWNHHGERLTPICDAIVRSVR
ncbi:MAG: serine hydrolase [Chloroflexi bacterium]|nr:serine hydrolase [Chloroflexota bacterium]